MLITKNFDNDYILTYDGKYIYVIAPWNSKYIINYHWDKDVDVFNSPFGKLLYDIIYNKIDNLSIKIYKNFEKKSLFEIYNKIDNKSFFALEINPDFLDYKNLNWAIDPHW